jgi:hypothetical protein
MQLQEEVKLSRSEANDYTVRRQLLVTEHIIPDEKFSLL